MLLDQICVTETVLNQVLVRDNEVYLCSSWVAVGFEASNMVLIVTVVFVLFTGACCQQRRMISAVDLNVTLSAH